MSDTLALQPVETWLQWFVTEQQPACRAVLGTQYALNRLDAEALINAALLQVWRHWAHLTNPLAYFWQTLRRSALKEGQRRVHAQQQLQGYVQAQRLHAHGAVRTTAQLDALLVQGSPRQQHLLTWYAQGYSDAEVAGWLSTTPQAVRVARHGAYRALRGQRGVSTCRAQPASIPRAGTPTKPGAPPAPREPSGRPRARRRPETS